MSPIGRFIIRWCCLGLREIFHQYKAIIIFLVEFNQIKIAVNIKATGSGKFKVLNQ